MEKFDFKVDETVDFTFSLNGFAPSPAPELPIVEMTQAEYDALESYDANTLYAIPEEVE